MVGRKLRTVALHDGEELDDDLRGRTDEDLALAALLSVDNVVLPGVESRVHCALSVDNTHKAVVLDRMINKGKPIRDS